MRTDHSEPRRSLRRGRWGDPTADRPARRLRLAFVAPLFVVAACGKEAPPPPPAAVPVKVVELTARDVPIYVEAIGESRGSTEIEIRARVEGFLQTVEFSEGSFVEKGQLLYTIDSSPFAARVARERANVATSEADHARAQQDVARYEPLVARNAVSRQDYETAVAIERAQAAAVEAARAGLRSAEIDMSYARVTAPDSGLVGKTEVHPGTLVGRGESTLLTQISKIDVIHARFTVPERDYMRLVREAGERGVAGAQPTFELILSDGSVHPHPGKLVFVDRNVDPTTATILLEAAFPNPERTVRPGQYARVRAVITVKQGAVLVPQRAVQELQGLYSVAVVGADDKVETRMVKLGDRIGAQWLVEEGVSPGERVVVEGLQKIRSGSLVEPEAVAAETLAAPPAAAGAAPAN